MPDRTPPVALILSAVYFRPDSKKNLLPEPVIIAQVLKTPAVEKNGEEVAYERYPLAKDATVLRKRQNYILCDTPGELTTTASIDTGGGPVKVNGGDGVVVANVEKTLDPHAVQQQYVDLVCTYVQRIFHLQSKIFHFVCMLSLSIHVV